MKNKQLRIFVDAHCFDKEYQGTTTYVRELYKELIKRKQIQFYFAAVNTTRLKDQFGEQENITYLKYRSHSPVFRLSYDIPQLVRKYKIDYAHFQYFTPVIKNCKQIVTIHDVIFNDYPEEFSFAYRKLKSVFYKRSSHTADVLTTVSDYSQLSIKKHFNIDNKNIHVIRNGVNAA